MKHDGIKLEAGYRPVIDKKTGKPKIEKILGFGLSASGKIAQKKSKRVKVKKP
jgi:hypothetical protein